MIDRSTPVVGIAPLGPAYDKTVANLEEIGAREGTIIAVVTEGDESLAPLVDGAVSIHRRHPGSSRYW